MDPTTGASTWALGSHIWPKKIGNLTKKASTILVPIIIGTELKFNW